MNRVFLAAPAVAAVLGLAVTGTAEASVAPAYVRHPYTMVRTVGPFSGTAKPGDPGGVPDGEALTVHCWQTGDKALRGTVKIVWGGDRRVLRIERRGTFFDSEVDLDGYYAFVAASGRRGQNTVVLTVTCRPHR